MVKYTIEDNAYTGSRISYDTSYSSSITRTTLNTETVTWDSYVTSTKYTTTIDTIPGTTSTKQVDVTTTYKGLKVTTRDTFTYAKDEYATVYIKRETDTATNPDGFNQNAKYMETYTYMVSNDITASYFTGNVTAPSGYYDNNSFTTSTSWVVISSRYDGNQRGSSSYTESSSWQTTCQKTGWNYNQGLPYTEGYTSSSSTTISYWSDRGTKTSEKTSSWTSTRKGTFWMHMDDYTSYDNVSATYSINSISYTGSCSISYIGGNVYNGATYSLIPYTNTASHNLSDQRVNFRFVAVRNGNSRVILNTKFINSTWNTGSVYKTITYIGSISSVSETTFTTVITTE